MVLQVGHHLLEVTKFNLIFYFPKGTGKTHVIVAAVEEIIKMEYTRNCVLICSSSNAACDELLDRIVSVLGDRDVLRLYAQSHEKKSAFPHPMFELGREYEDVHNANIAIYIQSSCDYLHFGCCRKAGTSQ